MSDRNYYVICEDNCKFPSMTQEQILAAIAEATGNTVTKVDDAFITKVKEMNANGNITFWIGTTAEYNAIVAAGAVEKNRLYILTDETFGDDVTAKIEEFYEQLENTANYVETQIAAFDEKINNALNDTDWQAFTFKGVSVGYYRKIGKIVHFNIDMPTSIFSNNSAILLPFLPDFPSDGKVVFSLIERTTAGTEAARTFTFTPYSAALTPVNSTVVSGNTITGYFNFVYDSENPIYEDNK